MCFASSDTSLAMHEIKAAPRVFSFLFFFFLEHIFDLHLIEEYLEDVQ